MSTVSGSHPSHDPEKSKYLSVIAYQLKIEMDEDHCEYLVNKATKCLNRLRRAMYGCTPAAKIIVLIKHWSDLT